jgi:FtsP/CotA-like multicopper oxidase with cupredoxin domain
MTHNMPPLFHRRALLRGAGSIALAGAALPAWAKSGGLPVPQQTLSGEHITLTIAERDIPIDGRMTRAVTINGGVPAPLLRLREGQDLTLTVVNQLSEPTSLHWHGLLLPFQMDGVPGVSFPGIPAGGSFTYRFPIRQSGTYWYHSHSGLQELLGAYGPIVIEPAAPQPPMREHVILLSDHSFTHPKRILNNLKADPGYYNRQPQTTLDLIKGRGQSLRERIEWGAMRMDPADIADVTGAVLRYLVNGHSAAQNWTGLFAEGEPVKLRFINAAGMSFFNIRIPDLPMTIHAADGEAVQPLEVDEFQIAPGETYDVVVRPPIQTTPRAYTIVAESMDRSGMARATLAPAMGMSAPVPALRQRPLLTMKDMGMDHGAGGMKGMKMRDGSIAPQVKLGPGVDMIAAMPMDRSGDPGIGLSGLDHRVLTYRDLVALAPNPDPRAPERELEVHLTGSMERYMWSMDGKVMSEAHEGIPMRKGERLRMTMINDTMMAHPIHLHGHYFELVTGHGDRSPRKHTAVVQPGGRLSFDLTAQEGDWAFHCHLFLHMAMGMMRVVKVRAA